MKRNCCGNFGYKIGTIICCLIHTAKRMIADLQGGQLTEGRCIGALAKLRNEPAGDCTRKE